MKRISIWYYLVTTTILLGVFLSLVFGPAGLIAVLAINLYVCHLSPDSFLFLKAPDSVDRHSGKQFYKASRTVGYVMGLTFFIFPITLAIIVLALQPPQTANFILMSSWTGTLNDGVRLTLGYIADPTSLPIDADEKTSQTFANMRAIHTKSYLYIIAFKQAAYIFIPIITALSTFDRTRAARSGYEFRVSRNKSSLSVLPISIGALAYLAALNYYASMSFIDSESFHSFRGGMHRFMGTVAISSVVGLCWLFILEFFDTLISRPRTFLSL